MPSTFNAQDAEAYERVMGRWSRRLAGPFLAFAGSLAGARVLDVGCGTGSLALDLAARHGIAAVEGIDVVPDYVAFAKARTDDPRLSFQVADACGLPFAADCFDASLALLSLHLMSDPEAALRELIRVTRPGGRIAGAVWDVRGGFPHARLFLDTAAMFDPAGRAVRERYMRVPLAQAGEMAALFSGLGLTDVAQESATVRFDFADFMDYWAPFLTGEGTMGGYVARLPPAAREELGAHLRAAYLCGAPDGPRSFAATAWLCRGTVPGGAA